MMKLILTCADELKESLKQEVLSLGFSPISMGHGYVEISLEKEEDFYRLHLNLSTAEEILLKIKDFSAKSGPMVFDQMKRLRYSDFFSKKKKLELELVGGKKLRWGSERDIFHKMQQGIRDSYKYYQQCEPLFSHEGEVKLVAYCNQEERIFLSINTSGRPLHKRGYRGKGAVHPASLKETLARSLLIMSGYKGETPLLDPFCGSGTIAIEAAMMSLNKATHIHRGKGIFAFEHLQLFKSELWRKVQDEARGEKESELRAPIFASDIEEKYIDYAKECALRARVEKYIDWKVQDFFDLTRPAEKGLIVTNVPYGERIDISAEEFERIGRHLKENFQGWKVVMLVSADSPYEKLYLRFDKKIKVKNGALDCLALIFSLR